MTYFGAFQEKAARACAFLKLLHPGFDDLSSKEMLCVLLDDSIVSRTEFKLQCRSNKCLAQVGAAHLTSYVAVKSFVDYLTPKEFQNLRDTRCTQVGKANQYDSLFKERDVMLFWGFEEQSEPTVRQKAECVDALLGVLVLLKKWDVASWLCEQIVREDVTKK
jgi:hypothetical protein